MAFQTWNDDAFRLYHQPSEFEALRRMAAEYEPCPPFDADFARLAADLNAGTVVPQAQVPRLRRLRCWIAARLTAIRRGGRPRPRRHHPAAD